MNKELIFLVVSLFSLGFSVISLFTAPVINNIKGEGTNFEFSKWGNLYCQLYSDVEENSNSLDQREQLRKIKNICYRQKAMYNLEFSSLIIDLILGFITAQLGLFLYFKIGESIYKISGIFGIIAGIICFVLTLVYLCFSGYIFYNDIAFKVLTNTSPYYDNTDRVKKLFSNGAIKKLIRTSVGSNPIDSINPFDGDEDDEAEFIKYRDLGKSQYNYKKKLYEVDITGCEESTTASNPQYASNTKDCQYLYPSPTTSLKNKYLYDNWVTTIIFSCFIILSNIALIIFGFMLFKNKDEPDLLIPNSDRVETQTKLKINK